MLNCFVLFLLSMSCYLVFHKNFSITSKQHITHTAPLAFHLPWELSCSQIAVSAVLCNELGSGITKLFSFFEMQVRCQWHWAQSHWRGQQDPRVTWRLVYTLSKTLGICPACAGTKKEGCDFAFYAFDIFLGTWKRRHFSMNLQRDFSLVWLRVRRSAVGQHGLFYRLLLFSAVFTLPFPYKADFCKQQIFAFTEYALNAK